MQCNNVASMRYAPDAFAPFDLYLVIKSQDQILRRQRLVNSLKAGRIGRIENRPVAEGLLLKGRVDPARSAFDLHSDFKIALREPRGLALLRDGTMLVAEIDRVIHLDNTGGMTREYRLPGFAFLHSIELSSDHAKALIVSSGYDLVVEIELASGKLMWDWLLWEHGFNPNLDGTYLTRDPDCYRHYKESGRPARLVNFLEGNSHGLMTSERSNHPNAACYDPQDERIFLATLGHSGDVIVVDVARDDWRYAVRGLASMPHAIQSDGDGWMVTNTLKGECWFLDRNFQVREKLVFSDLSGKPAELADNEWLQSVHRVSRDVVIGLDANRGLILVDVAARLWSRVVVDQNWCVHLARTA